MEQENSPVKPLSRYYTYAQFEEVFLEIVKTFPPDSYSFSFLGSSVENRSIYGLKIGHGDFKILAWSQMHGNESTTTRAILDLLKSKDLFKLLEGISLYIIPVLNPDGAHHWTRNNANDVDLNRDAQDLSQPESIILRDALDFFNPDLALNLHGQRTIYGVESNALPCQLSFLSPSADEKKSITPARVTSMNLINLIVNSLKFSMNAAIGRYDDSFNINCWGDYCQSIEIPCILFEAGHAGDDYSRDVVKNLIVDALKVVLSTATASFDFEHDAVVSEYFELPEVRKNHVDLLIKNMISKNGSMDIAIMYHEQVINGHLEFVPMIYAINEKSIHYGHSVIELTDNKQFKHDFVVHEDMSVSCESLKIRCFNK